MENEIENAPSIEEIFSRVMEENLIKATNKGKFHLTANDNDRDQSVTKKFDSLKDAVKLARQIHKELCKVNDGHNWAKVGAYFDSRELWSDWKHFYRIGNHGEEYVDHPDTVEVIAELDNRTIEEVKKDIYEDNVDTFNLHFALFYKNSALKSAEKRELFPTVAGEVASENSCEEVIQEEFDFDNLPDGVGFETDKGIFTFCRDDDAFSNRQDNIYLEIESDFDSALTFAVRYGSVEKAIQAIDSGQELQYEKNHRAKVKNILEQAKDWTFVFDVNNDTTEILRGEEAKKAVLDTIAKQAEFDKRYYAIRNIDLKTKPKTNAEKLQQFFKKAAHQQYNPMLYGDDYMKEGVKQFLLATPSVKLEQMTKLIDTVAPDAVYNSQYTENLKTIIKNDKDFQAKLAANKKSVSAKGR